MEIQLNITQDVLNKLSKENLEINHFFILKALYENNFDILDTYDKSNTHKPVLLEYTYLQVHGLIEEDDEVLFKITETGKELIENVCDVLSVKPIETEDSFKILCTEYLALFPKVKLPSGSYARSNSLEIQKKLKVFINTYKPIFKKEYGFTLTYEDILTATKIYIDRFASSGYKFMMTSSYLIKKGDKSILADEIIALKQGINTIIIDKPKSNITTM